MAEVIEQDAATPEVITPDQEQTQALEAPEAPKAAPEAPKESFQERNWKLARAKMEEQQRQIEEMNQQLAQLRAQKENQAVEEEEKYFTDTERKLNNEIKQLKQAIQKNEAKESDYVVDRLRLKYSDFDEVMHPENIEYLKSNNAALAKALAALKNEPYEQGMAAYDALKNTEWYKQRHTMQDKAKLEENIKKPVSVQAVRKAGALAEANTFVNGLTPELKASLQKEMAEARKRA